MPLHKFKLTSGKHTDEDKHTYNAKDHKNNIVVAPYDLCALFPNKFQDLGEVELPPLPDPPRPAATPPAAASPQQEDPPKVTRRNRSSTPKIKFDDDPEELAGSK